MTIDERYIDKRHSRALRMSASAFVQVYSDWMALAQIMDVAESLRIRIDSKQFNTHLRHRKD